ncbi:MAG: DinB family protein [Anaerolineae bacterium]|nr:DinB family protein [Anaerolineae bacterium]
MTNTIPVEVFLDNIRTLLTETFEQVRGIYLDRGTSLFETLETITPEMASIPVSATCATLAAQVEHTTFYIDLLVGNLTGNPPQQVDWSEIWNRVSAVTPEAWETSKARLKSSYQRVLAVLDGVKWDDNRRVGEIIAIVAHTAYHLGEIRQALCTLR